MYFHYSKVFLNIVRSNPSTWMHLPVGYNNNTTKPAMEFTKVVLKYQQVKSNNTCLYDSVASAFTYAYEHKKGYKLLKQVAVEISQSGKKNEMKPYDVQIVNVISIINKFKHLFNTGLIIHLVGNNKKRKKNRATPYDPLCKYI